MAKFKSSLCKAYSLISVGLLYGSFVLAQNQYPSAIPDITKWEPQAFREKLFEDHFACGEDALNYIMQMYNWGSNRDGKTENYSKLERLLSTDPEIVRMTNEQIRNQCASIKENFEQWKSYDSERRELNIMVLLCLRVPDKLEPETHAAIRDLLKFVDLTSEGAKLVRWLYRDINNPTWVGSPGGNCSNSHGCLYTLTLAPALIEDNITLAEGQFGLLQELNHMNTSGDISEFNCMEAHWNGTQGWEMIKKYVPDPYYRRVARIIAERIWINRFLTWSPAVEKITGPGSRVAPAEIFGCSGLRPHVALGMKNPIWMNSYFEWDGYAPSKKGGTGGGGWDQIPTDAIVPDLPDYLQDLAWHKTYPNEIHLSVDFKQWDNYPPLENVPFGNPFRPAKYVNYQTENYAIGSTTSRWFVNTCILNSTVWWNNSRKSDEPLGSPKRFCALYPHYVFNGMCFTEKGGYYFEKDPDNLAPDGWLGPGGPWMREFVEFGQAGILQDKNTMILTYSPKPGTHNKGEMLVKEKTNRASAAMFFFRWDDSLEGLYVNEEKLMQLPYELKPGDWWIIEDGDVYAAVRPLKSTSLKGNCKTILEKRKHHIVLYQDNVNASDILGISDEDWVKSQSGFIVEMGDKKEYGTFKNFRDKILSSKVTTDDAISFERHVVYQREGKTLEMLWDCYKEEYSVRKINGQEDEWTRYAQSPEFVVNDNGLLKTHDALLKTAAGNSLWLLSASTNGSWVAYQSQFDKELPVDLTCPVARIRVEKFPFGKLVVHQKENRIQLEIDAGYTQSSRGNENESTNEYRIAIDTPLEIEEVLINGISYTPEMIKKDKKKIYSVNPYSKLKQLEETMKARTVATFPVLYDGTP